MSALVTGSVSGVVDTFGTSLKYATCFGRFWYLTIIFRVMMIYTIGTNLYSNDESSFNCATKQFLCETVCFNQFMPINLNRYWQWQTLRLGKSSSVEWYSIWDPLYMYGPYFMVNDFDHFKSGNSCSVVRLANWRRKRRNKSTRQAQARWIDNLKRKYAICWRFGTQILYACVSKILLAIWFRDKCHEFLL